MVDIALERDHDNPQLIFESLNSTGLDLSQADLIRNYVLMGLPPQGAGRDLHQLLVPARAVVPGRAPGPVRPLHARLPDDEDGPDPEDRPRLRELQDAGTGRASSRTPTSSPTSTSTRRTGSSSPSTAPTTPALREAIADLNQLKVDVAYPFLLEVHGRPRRGHDQRRRARRGRPPRRELRLPPGDRRHPDQHPQQDVRRARPRDRQGRTTSRA